MLEVIAILLIIVGILLLLIPKGNVKVYFGFGGFIGPVPFGFANHPLILLLIIFLTLLVLILLYIWR